LGKWFYIRRKSPQKNGKILNPAEGFKKKLQGYLSKRPILLNLIL